jgi:hypothetical protein
MIREDAYDALFNNGENDSSKTSLTKNMPKSILIKEINLFPRMLDVCFVCDLINFGRLFMRYCQQVRKKIKRTVLIGFFYP